MKKNILLLLALIFLNCSSSNSSSSPFIGNWAGTWTDPVTLESGAISITIDTNGNVTGSVRNTTLNMNGEVGGTVDDNGNANFTYTYPGPTTYTETGAVSINSSTQLVGNLNEYLGGTLIGTATINLIKQMTS